MWDALKCRYSRNVAAKWQATIDPELAYQTYHSESAEQRTYHINDATLDQDIIDARSSADQEYRKSVYKQCLDIILDWQLRFRYIRDRQLYESSECVKQRYLYKDVSHSTQLLVYKDMRTLN